MKRKHENTSLRWQIADLAARIIAEEGISSFAVAKRKAAARLGVGDRLLPDNQEIEEKLYQYQRLFQSHHQPEELRLRRKVAMQAMKLLQQFNPKLVGAVLSGTATEHSSVCLHLFTDTPEEVAMQLHNQMIPHTMDEIRLRLSNKAMEIFPIYTFFAGDVKVELVVFPHDEYLLTPISPVDGRPMRRANLAKLQEILALSSETQEDSPQRS